MAGTSAGPEFPGWFRRLLALVFNNAVSLLEAQRQVSGQARDVDRSALLAATEQSLMSPQVTLDQRRRLASLTLVAVAEHGNTDEVLRRARRLTLLQSIDVLTERHDGAVFAEAERIGDLLVVDARSSADADAVLDALVLAGRLYLEPFAPDPASDHYEVTIAARVTRQARMTGVLAVDYPHIVRMPDSFGCLQRALSLFDEAVRDSVGHGRGVATAYLAFTHFTRSLVGRTSQPA